jgi:CRISPR type III-B/RAMP module RAMP protein Cmr4
MTNAHLYVIHALSPLHAGTGQGTGVIDLPIAREKATGIPYLAGSSVKGVLRDSNKLGLSEEDQSLFFGPSFKKDNERPEDNAGAAIFSDARLLLFPVRSLRGTFAWVTSPYILNRFAREVKEVQSLGNILPKEALPNWEDRQAIWVAEPKHLTLQKPKTTEQWVVLEDLDLKYQDSLLAKEWLNALKKILDEEEICRLLDKHFAIVHDDVMNFLLRNATEIVARIRLNPEAKTVEQGALWYEESLPAESLLTGVITAQSVKQRKENGDSYTAKQVSERLSSLQPQIMQFGGKATVGRGLCRFSLVGGK